MARIIAGNFATLQESEPAQAALIALLGAPAVSVFHLNAAGQHDRYPIGGDRFKDPDATDAGSAAVSGAAAGAAVGVVAGAVVTPILGPIGIAAGAAAGAYAGSLIGGVQEMGHPRGDGQNDTPIRPAGVMVAALTDGSEHEATVVAALRDAGARMVEEADGTWVDRDWTDFDPVSQPRIIFARSS